MSITKDVVRIIFRRGSTTDIDNEMDDNGITKYEGEPRWNTDTKTLWIYDGSNNIRINGSDNSITLLKSTSNIDLNAASDTETTLYTVPTGKKCIITHVVIRNLSASAANAVITLGKTGGSCDEFRGNQILSGLNSAGKYTVIYLDQETNDTPEASIELNGGDSFGIEITTSAGSSCTVTIDVFGYEL
jgi:hypothetical protein